MRIGIDVDEVLYPWYDRAHEWCVKCGLTDGAVAPTSWAPYDDYGVPAQDWYDALEAAGWRLYEAAPIPGAVESLNRLRAAGHTIHLVTARGGFANGAPVRKWTIDWLREYEVPFDSLTFSADKTLVRVGAFLDDSPRNYDALTDAGCARWLVEAAHNAADREWRLTTPSLAVWTDRLLGGAL